MFPEAGNYTVFTPSMPGEPDNIRAASNNSYWVAINLARNGSEKVLFDYLSNKVSNQYVSTLNYLV